MSDTLNPDCPPDALYFIDPSQFERSDLSALPIEEILGAHGDIGRMLQLMHEHQVPEVRSGRERSIGGVSLLSPSKRFDP